MQPRDVHLWEKFVRANAGFFTSCDYDVPVGPPPDWLDVEGDEMARKQAKLYQKKIDVVGYNGNDIYIVEVKPQAGSSAVGQILSYKLYWKKDNPDLPEPKLLVITNKLQNGYEPVYHSHKILVAETGFCPRCNPI